jgi:hypothetical protein
MLPVTECSGPPSAAQTDSLRFSSPSGFTGLRQQKSPASDVFPAAQPMKPFSVTDFENLFFTRDKPLTSIFRLFEAAALATHGTPESQSEPHPVRES